MITLELIFGQPEPGAKVRRMSDLSANPQTYTVASADDRYVRLQGPGHYPECEFFAVPAGTLLRVVQHRHRPAGLPQAAADRSADPEGLADCKTADQFKALAQRLGLSKEQQEDVWDTVSMAPNAGQRVMRGRNFIRNAIRRAK